MSLAHQRFGEVWQLWIVRSALEPAATSAKDVCLLQEVGDRLRALRNRAGGARAGGDRGL